MSLNTRMQFNLEIVREGLMGISSSREEMIRLNSSGLVHLDDVFDPMPLDYIQYLLDVGVVTDVFVSRFKILYGSILVSTDKMSAFELDEFIAAGAKVIEDWRTLASGLLSELNHV